MAGIPPVEVFVFVQPGAAPLKFSLNIETPVTSPPLAVNGFELPLQIVAEGGEIETVDGIVLLLITISSIPISENPQSDVATNLTFTLFEVVVPILMLIKVQFE